MSKRVLVAMSGGVDSSTAALLLKEQGYDVVGAHMKLWDYADVGTDGNWNGQCCPLDTVIDCRKVCSAMGIPFYVLDLSARFKRIVIENFVSEYKAGRTPNPCIRCNTDVKWDWLLRKAHEIGCDYIATGHYAIVEPAPNSRYCIRKGADSARDQSYVLWGLTQEALSHTLMPLGRLLKSEVREIARNHDLCPAERKESREICFVTDDDYRRFLREYEQKQGRSFSAGEIEHENGQVLGTHDGAAFFTIGQRRGLGIAYPTPLYVRKIDIANNRVIVGDNESLFSSEATIENVNWVGMEPTDGTFNADVKIRYQHPGAPAQVTRLTSNTVRVIFDKPQRAITPGQSAVFYGGDVLLGGGVIA